VKRRAPEEARPTITTVSNVNDLLISLEKGPKEGTQLK